ncbi:hypothetical protein CIL05_12240 [Virgibacillus profundi]|uniref:Uncharacterized protein n=1 Tax=Virgibacillus profundi TaxID=2024555 RepID=A0A2A2IC63_9BACI|nr:hypothetical protein CIL05_12240 [Virgibacillus profundi]PXY53331.1 hypothetical protein CIT14_12365 [Virgibacillus profundi]
MGTVLSFQFTQFYTQLEFSKQENRPPCVFTQLKHNRVEDEKRLLLNIAPIVEYFFTISWYYLVPIISKQVTHLFSPKIKTPIIFKIGACFSIYKY